MLLFCSYLLYKHFNPTENVNFPMCKESLTVELVGFVRAPSNRAGCKRKLEDSCFLLENICEHFPERG